MKRFLSLLLSALLLVTMLSCTKGNEPDETAPQTGSSVGTSAGSAETAAGTAPGTEPAVIGSQLSEYKIVRADGTPDQEMTAVLKRLRAAIAAVTGKEPSLQTDYVKSGKKVPTGTKEILIGRTNRPESKNAHNALGQGGYSVTVENDRIVLAYTSTAARELCVDYFVKEVLHVDEKKGTSSLKSLRSDEIVPYIGAMRAEDTAKLLEGLFNGKTDEVMDKRNVGGSFFMHFGDLVWVEDKIYCYYISYEGTDGVGGVGLAISEDYGETFKSKGTVIYPGAAYDGELCAFAGVWYEEGTFYLVYEACPAGGAADVALATSTDGIHFKKDGIILKKDPNSDWMNYNVGTPDLFKSGDTWYLTFHGFGSGKKDCQIGLAYGKDLHKLTVLKNPIIPTVEGTERSGTTGRRDVIYLDGWYYMVFEVSTNSGVDGVPYYDFGNSDWGHMFARSKNMKQWEVCDAPIYETTGRGFGNDGPAWLTVGNEIYVLIRNDHNCTDRLRLTLKK